MRIIQLHEDSDEKRWDGYVRPRTATVTDLAGWRQVVHETYRLRSHFLAATEDDRIVGSLGLLEVKHPIFGHHLTTAPFGNDGGFHFDNLEARDLLLKEAKRLANELDVDYLLIRTRGLDLDGFVIDYRYATAVIDLAGGVDSIWKHTLKSKTRNQIRRGLKEGFRIETGVDQMRAFYDVLHAHMRDLGSPAHSLSFYRSIVKHLGASAQFFVVRDHQELVAGALLFKFNGTAMNFHTVALQNYNRRCPNYLIYWKMLESSCATGCSKFDMGRSLEASSVMEFKCNWGPQIIPLSYNYYLRKRKDLPYVDPCNPKYQIPIAVWRRLPLFVTKSLGPYLISGLA